jgi:transcription antitermination factor NusG
MFGRFGWCGVCLDQGSKMKTSEENRMAASVSLDTLVDEPRDPRWYVVISEPRRERQALCRLREGGFVSYLPMRPVAKKNATHAAPLFPGYLFVQFDINADRWPHVFTTLDVAGMVTRTSRTNRPIPLAMPVGAVRRILSEEIEGLVLLAKKDKPGDKRVVGSPFKAGQRVKIVGGPFMDMDALFQTGDANRIAVLIHMLGGETVVNLATTEASAA